MRAPLTGITVQIDEHTVPASSTIAAVGGNVLILATAVPSRALTLTSCYLARSDAAIAVSQLIADAHEERLQQHMIAPSTLQSTLAGTCLLEHAAALRELLERRTQTHVAVDVDPQALDRAATVWAPSASMARPPRQ